MALWWHVSSRIWEGVVMCVEKVGGDEVGGRKSWRKKKKLAS